MSAALALGRQAWISARILWDAPFVVRFRGVLQALLAVLLLVAVVVLGGLVARRWWPGALFGVAGFRRDGARCCRCP